MRYGCVLWVMLQICVLGCMPLPFSPPPATVHAIAVLPPNNRTGDPLVVSGSSWWNPYSTRRAEITVADVLAAEAREQVQQRGFAVVPEEEIEAAIGSHAPDSLEEATALVIRNKLAGSALYIEITHWEPDTSLHPGRVLVALEAALIDTATGRVEWTAHRRLGPILTPGAVTLWAAHLIAVHEVTTELLASWGTKQSPS